MRWEISPRKSRPHQPAAKRPPASSRRAPPIRSLLRPAFQDLLPMDHDERQQRRYQSDHRRPDKGHETLLPTHLRLHLSLVLHGRVPRLDADLVSCHMDLKPENILYDGRRVWLIDWMAAFLNVRYFDLAIVANFVVT